MQFQKEDIRESILAAAREEFSEKGFEKASIRTITAKAKTAKSNLYNYFKDKNDLFCAVLEPTVAEIRNGLELAKQYNVPKETEEYTMSSQAFVIGVIRQFVTGHAPDISLLLFKAQGSPLENFKHEVLDAFTDSMVDWTQSMESGKKVTRLFVRSVCSFYLNMIEQMFLFGSQGDDMETFFKETSVFVYHGWKNVLS